MPSTLTKLSKKITAIKFELSASQALLEMNDLAQLYLDYLTQLAINNAPLLQSMRETYIENNQDFLFRIRTAATVFPELVFDTSIYKQLSALPADQRPNLSKRQVECLQQQLDAQRASLSNRVEHLDWIVLPHLEYAKKQEEQRAEQEKQRKEVDMLAQALDEFDRYERQQLQWEQVEVLTKLTRVERDVLTDVSDGDNSLRLSEKYYDLKSRHGDIKNQMRQSRSADNIGLERMMSPLSSSSSTSLPSTPSTLFYEPKKAASPSSLYVKTNGSV